MHKVRTAWPMAARVQYIVAFEDCCRRWPGLSARRFCALAEIRQSARAIMLCRDDDERESWTSGCCCELHHGCHLLALRLAAGHPPETKLLEMRTRGQASIPVTASTANALMPAPT